MLNPGQGETKAVLIATGSEVHLALEAQAVLAKEGTAVSVVSMPSWDTFEMRAQIIKLPFCLKVCRRLLLKPALL